MNGTTVRLLPGKGSHRWLSIRLRGEHHPLRRNRNLRSNQMRGGIVMRLPWVRTSRVLTVAVLTVAITAGAAFAKGGPRITEVMATFSLDTVRDHPVQCQGEDGTYVQDVSLDRGTQSSSKPELNGRARVVVHVLINIDTGIGANFGRFTVTDPHTKKVTADSIFVGVIKGNENKGIELGKLRGGEALIANFSVLIDPNTGHVDGEIGASPGLVTSDLAAVWNLRGCGHESFWRDYQAALASVGR